MESSIDEYIKRHANLFVHSPTARALKLAEKYKVLGYMAQRYLDFLKDEAEEFLRSCSLPLRRAIRCNTLKLDSCERLVRSLELKGFKLEPVKWIKYFYWVNRAPSSPTLGSTFEYLSGQYYIQSPVSGVPVVELNPNPSDTVLDMAAAPGGKTSFIAQLMRNQGLIVAVESSRDRTKSLMSNLSRLGVANTLILRQRVEKLVNVFFERFDRVLLDAPCSGEGLLPLDPARRTKTSPEDLLRFFETQLVLIDAAYKMVRPGGLLVYSTCSIAPEENEFVVEYLLENYDDVKVENVSGGYPVEEGLTEYRKYILSEELRHCIRFYPHKSGTEGFFVCKLRRGN